METVRWVVVLLSGVAGAVILGTLLTSCPGVGQCFETLEDQNCVPGSVDYREGWCECDTKFGRISWEVPPGCGFR